MASQSVVLPEPERPVTQTTQPLDIQRPNRRPRQTQAFSHRDATLHSVLQPTKIFMHRTVQTFHHVLQVVFGQAWVHR